MAGILYLVATPIGNLGDLSPRAVETLAQADFIAAEDTRVSLRLLNHFDIRKPLVSYHEHNRAAAGPAIAERLLGGESCALVTDAGTPAISDPGEDLVRLCGQQGITVQAIPGCCAAVCALAVSGLPTGRFCFEGFLSANKKERRTRLEELSHEERTMVFHEAPHKLLHTLEDLLETLVRPGGGRGRKSRRPGSNPGSGGAAGAAPAAGGGPDEGRRPPGGGGHRSAPQRSVQRRPGGDGIVRQTRAKSLSPGPPRLAPGGPGGLTLPVQSDNIDVSQDLQEERLCPRE